LGWCGLDRVPPPSQALPTLEEQQCRLRKEHDDLSARIAEKTAALAGLEAEAEATRSSTALHSRHAALQQRLREAIAEVEHLKADRAANELAQESCARLAAQWRAGNWGDPRAHLRNPALPLQPATLRLSRLAAVWGGVSIGVLLVGFAVLSWFSISLVPSVVALIGVYAFMEALFHRSLAQLLRACVVALALLTLLVLLLQFYQAVLLVAVVLVGLLIIIDNLREVLG
jgi:ABC-type multidrug transport system fused ATPase/permease subunit